ncbi:hypothetical protein D3C79_1075550 [compost metagenome]
MQYDIFNGCSYLQIKEETHESYRETGRAHGQLQKIRLAGRDWPDLLFYLSIAYSLA